MKHKGVGENRGRHASGLIAVFLAQFLAYVVNRTRVLVCHFVQQTSRSFDTVDQLINGLVNHVRRNRGQLHKEREVRNIPDDPAERGQRVDFAASLPV